MICKDVYEKTTILSQKQENYLLVILNMVNILNNENSKKYINLKEIVI